MPNIVKKWDRFHLLDKLNDQEKHELAYFLEESLIHLRTIVNQEDENNSFFGIVYFPTMCRIWRNSPERDVKTISDALLQYEADTAEQYAGQSAKTNYLALDPDIERSQIFAETFIKSKYPYFWERKEEEAKQWMAKNGY